jgi:hypothetical protein
MPAQHSSLRSSIISKLLGRLNLRFPGFFLILALLTATDMLIPDLIPFADEIGLGLLTLLLAMWKNRRTPLTPDKSQDA